MCRLRRCLGAVNIAAVLLILLSGVLVTDGDAALAQSQSDHCPLTDMRISGQGPRFRPPGGGGGSLSQAELDPSEIIDPGWIVQAAKDLGWWPDTTDQWTGFWDERVAVVILDDFHNLQHQDYIPHGHRVGMVFGALHNALLQARLDEMGTGLSATDPDVMQKLMAGMASGMVGDVFFFSWARMEILSDQAAPLEFYTTQALRDRLHEELHGLYYDAGISRFVLNMSFMLVPCEAEVENSTLNYYDFMNWFSQDPANRSLIDYILVQLLGVPYQQYPENYSIEDVERAKDLVTELIEQAEGEPDPLYDFIHALTNTDSLEGVLGAVPKRRGYADLRPSPHEADGGTKVIPVASSGNEGKDRPALPAAWAEVIAASAGVGTGNAPRWDGSNAGEVMAPGASYVFDSMGFAGTSYAAPGVSLLMALDLARPTPVCGVSGGKPVLAHEANTDLPIDDAAAVQSVCR